MKIEEQIDSGAFADAYLIYDRKSTDDADNQKNSLIYQRQRNMEYAEREKITIASLTLPGFCTNGIIDESHSAFKQEDEFVISTDGSVQYRIMRKKFAYLVSLLHARKIKGVIFLCWDRASRNEQDELIIKRLIQLGHDIRFTEVNYEKSSAGDLHRDVDGMFAKHYSRNISEKVKNAQRKLRDEKRDLQISPIGYLDMGSDNKPLDPERAPIVKRIFELYATGEWSIRQLALWARGQGLTKKPARRKRTKEELANNLDSSTIEKIARPVDHKTIEYMLPNPYYIGKTKIGDRYEDSIAHQALIDTSLFHKVQAELKKRRVSVHYVDRPFYAYRGLVRCVCGRGYSPYLQKGIVYYRSRCKEGCANDDPNLSEDDVSAAVQAMLDKVSFSDEELAEIDKRAKTELKEVAKNRDSKLNDLQARQRNVIADIDYMTQNKVSILRTGAMGPDELKSERERLEAKLSLINEEIKIYAESAPEMLKYIISFSELIKNTGLYFEHALDSEKREIATMVFTELIFKDRQLVGYNAKDGFDALLKRFLDVTKSDSTPHDGLLPSNEVLGSLSWTGFEHTIRHTKSMFSCLNYRLNQWRLCNVWLSIAAALHLESESSPLSDF